MRALFIHDHRVPFDGDTYYYSSGLDTAIISRYINIFGEFGIFARQRIVQKNKENIIKENVNISTISNYKDLYLYKQKKVLEKCISESDILIIRMPSILGSISIKIAKRMKKPYILEVVSSAYDALINSHSLKRKILALPVEMFYKHMIKRNKYLAYVTENFLEKEYPSSGKYIACSDVSFNSIEESVLLKRIDKIKKMKLTDKIIIGTCGTLDVYFKGQQYVIKALQILKKLGLNVEYQMVGDGDGEWLMKYAKKLKVESSVKVIGRLNHDKVFEWLDSLDVYVHPSCQEGLSRSIVEAMSRACPVVASNAGGTNELIDGKFVIKKKKYKKFAMAIYKIINEDLENQSRLNFEKSKNYLCEILDEKRKTFYLECYNESLLKDN